MKIDWNAKVVSIEHIMNLHDVCNLLLELTEGEQVEVVIEVLCNLREEQIQTIKSWLAD